MRADSRTCRPSSPNLPAALVLLALASLGAGCDKKLSGIELRAAPQLVKGATAQLRAAGYSLRQDGETLLIRAEDVK